MLRDKRNDTEFTYEALKDLGEIFVKGDVVNFHKDKVGGGFPKCVADTIVAKAELYPDSRVLIVEDLDFTMTAKLLEAGVDLANVYLAYCEFDKKSKKLYGDRSFQCDTMRRIAATVFRERLNIIAFQEALDMKEFDLIIANPPYGPIGADITKKIIDEVGFKQYINLMPANDYKRNKEKNLFQYVKSMESLGHCFDDASVTTHIAEMQTVKNQLTLREFELSQYLDPSLDKYFRRLDASAHYAFNGAALGGDKVVIAEAYDPELTFIIAMRDIAHGHMPYSKTCDTYRYNVLKNLSTQELIERRLERLHGQETGRVTVEGITFNTAVEKNNFSDFVYSDLGFRFIAKVFTAVNVNRGTQVGKVFPKVDWTRSWTVEEILKDYGYADSEIKEVMDDLPNFKGMND